MHNTKKTQLTDAELMRYARQIILPEWDIAAQLRLVNSTVSIIGMGGLGCPIAQTLARAGVGTLNLVDFDCIEASNLQRQNLFTINDIGKNKALAAYDALTKQAEFGYYTVVTERVTANTVDATIKHADLVIDTTDNFSTRDIMNRACVRAGVPLLSVAAVAQAGQLAMYDFTDENQPCYHCVFGDDDVQDMRCAEVGVLASTTQTMGGLAAHVALHFLGRGENLLPNKLLVWDGMRFMQRLFSYKKNKHCPVCM